MKFNKKKFTIGLVLLVLGSFYFSVHYEHYGFSTFAYKSLTFIIIMALYGACLIYSSFRGR